MATHKGRGSSNLNPYSNRITIGLQFFRDNTKKNKKRKVKRKQKFSLIAEASQQGENQFINFLSVSYYVAGRII